MYKNNLIKFVFICYSKGHWAIIRGLRYLNSICSFLVLFFWYPWPLYNAHPADTQLRAWASRKRRKRQVAELLEDAERAACHHLQLSLASSAQKRLCKCGTLNLKCGITSGLQCDKSWQNVSATCRTCCLLPIYKLQKRAAAIALAWHLISARG